MSVLTYLRGREANMKNSAKGRGGSRRHEAVVAEMKVALARALGRRRKARGLSQRDVARRLGSSQSRVSKIEGGDSEVSLDLLVRALAAAGASRREIGRVAGGV